MLALVCSDTLVKYRVHAEVTLACTELQCNAYVQSKEWYAMRQHNTYALHVHYTHKHHVDVTDNTGKALTLDVYYQTLPA